MTGWRPLAGGIAASAVCILAAPASVPAGSGSPRAAVVPVEMTSRAGGPRFEPAEPVVRAGDTVRFRHERGGPHNVQFFADSIGEAARAPLEAAMPARIGPLAGPLLFDPGDQYDVVVPALAPGRYPFVCAPHWSGGMRGAMVVAASPGR